MSTDWKADKQRVDHHNPFIRACLGIALIREGTTLEDATENTDLKVIRLGNIRIACRVRDHSHLVDYGHQFTIRANRPSGSKSEMAKITIDGWGDYLFYAFGNPDNTGIEQYTIIDLAVFRKWVFRSALKTHTVPGELIENHDKSSSFYAFNLKDAPPDAIVAEWNRRDETTRELSIPIQPKPPAAAQQQA
jgi:hypothetical protein